MTRDRKIIAKKIAKYADLPQYMKYSLTIENRAFTIVCDLVADITKGKLEDIADVAIA